MDGTIVQSSPAVDRREEGNRSRRLHKSFLARDGDRLVKVVGRGGNESQQAARIRGSCLKRSRGRKGEKRRW